MSRRVGSPKALVTALTAAVNSSGLSPGCRSSSLARGYSTYVRSGNVSAGAAGRSDRMPTESDVLEALRPVEDPEIHRSIVDLDMVKEVAIDGGAVKVTVALTVSGLPAQDRDHPAGDRGGEPARRSQRGRRRPHGDERRAARGAGAAAAVRARHRRRRRAAGAGQPVHRRPHAGAGGRVGEGRSRASRRSAPTSRSRSRSAVIRWRRSTPTSGASRCRACSGSTGRRSSSTT